MAAGVVKENGGVSWEIIILKLKLLRGPLSEELNKAWLMGSSREGINNWNDPS